VGIYPLARIAELMQLARIRPAVRRRREGRRRMKRSPFALMLALSLPVVAPARAGPLDLPDPQVYARAEDRERARLILTPCAPADEGRGCERENGTLSRKSPCTYRIDRRTIGFLPTDQC
jgi:hypothetical protein